MTQQGIIRTVPEEGGFYDPPAQIVEARHCWPTHEFFEMCDGCGVLAWDVAEERQIPKPGKPIICWNCGTDNGLPALPAPRWWERLIKRGKAWH